MLTHPKFAMFCSDTLAKVMVEDLKDDSSDWKEEKKRKKSRSK